MSDTKGMRRRGTAGLLAATAIFFGLFAPVAAQTKTRVELGLSGLAEWSLSSYGNEFFTLPGFRARIDLPGPKGVGLSFEATYLGGGMLMGGVNVLLCSSRPRIIRPYAVMGLILMNFYLPLPQAGAGLKIDFSKSLGLDFGVRYWLGFSSLIVTTGVSIGF
jgi:hypothetical protein